MLSSKRLITLLFALLAVVTLLSFASTAHAEEPTENVVEVDLAKLAGTSNSKKDDAITINLDGSSPIAASHEDAPVEPEEVVLPPGFNPSTSAEGGEKFQFQSENSRILNIVINSLYKSKEIFLRELISNSADALDKIRFHSLTKPDELSSKPELEIKIVADKDRKLLVIRDTGVGMTAQELKKNLGTIAKSGTAEFLGQLEANPQDMGLIGQFGVGFYSVFLVCDKVTVASKSNKDDQYLWESTSENDFTIVKDPRGNTLGRGTEITLHIKNDSTEFVQDSTIAALITKYSEFINFPIYLWQSEKESYEVPVEDEPVDISEDGVEDVSDDSDKPKTKTEFRTVHNWKRMNENKPIWTRAASTIAEEEYNSFYKSFTKDTVDPLAYSHFKAEGEVEFKGMIFIPAKAPRNFLQQVDSFIKNIKLYVRRVFITEDLEDFLPRWLSFLKGLIDSDDLPLNVSRETLQKHGALKVMKKKVVQKAIELITQISKDEEKYSTFYKEYATAIKLGVIEERQSRTKLMPLLRYHTSASESASFADYKTRMKGKQPQIYYITAGNIDEAKSSPVAELAIARGYEVIYFVDPLDEYLLQQIQTANGVPLQSLGKSGVLFGDEDDHKDEEEKLTEEFSELSDWLKESLSDSVEKVVISTRLTSSPVAVVASNHGLSGNMERIMAAQALQSGDDMMSNYYKGMKKTLEINPLHPVIIALQKKVAKGATNDELKEQVRVLYELGLLRSGFDIKNTLQFATRVEHVLRSALGVSKTDEAKFDVKPAPEKEDLKKEESSSSSAEDEDIENVFEHEEL